MRNSKLFTATVVALSLALGGCASSLTGDTYSRDEARKVQTVRMGTIEMLRPVKIEGTKTPIGAGAGAVIGGVAGSGVGGGRGSAVTAVKQWRFVPARKGQKAISAYVHVPLSFSLTQE